MAGEENKSEAPPQGNETTSAPLPQAQVQASPPPLGSPPSGPPTLYSSLGTDSLAQYPNPFYSLQSGYNLIIYIVKHFLGFDPGFVINLSIILAGLSTVGRHATNYLYYYVKKWITASTRIHEDEILLYHDVLRFMSENWLKNRVFQDVKASTYGYVGIGEDSDDEAGSSDDESEEEDFDEDDEGNEKQFKYYNFKARSAVRFQPYELSRIFYYKRNIFFFRHSLRVVASSNPVIGHRQSGELLIECLGRSLEPIRRFLEDAQNYCEERSTQTTSIFRANGANWMLIGRRPSRDINTVILEKGKKRRLLRDMHEYISPSTKKWYANHGIPYRRGYLFSGPAGVGKTSLTAALAGVFGLDIYVLSLLDPMINEDALVRLFSSVGPRSIVLLEDIDAAGLTSKRSRAKVPKQAAQFGGPRAPRPAPPGPPPPFMGPPGAALSFPAPPRPPTPPIGVSLSGLLNAIDGVSSSEGHILIMTTNHPEDLDPALVRPGRVDMHVHFTLPHRQEIMEMFLSMYKDISKVKKKDGKHEAEKDHEDKRDFNGKDTEESKKPAESENGDAEEYAQAGAEREESKSTSSTPELISVEANGVIKGPEPPAPKENGVLEQPMEPNGTIDKSGEANGTLEEPKTPKQPPPSKVELQELASKFADALPEGKLSLAAIQGLLLTHKKDPRRAVAVAKDWAEETLKQIEEGEKEENNEDEDERDEERQHGPEHIEIA